MIDRVRTTHQQIRRALPKQRRDTRHVYVRIAVSELRLEVQVTLRLEHAHRVLLRALDRVLEDQRGILHVREEGMRVAEMHAEEQVAPIGLFASASIRGRDGSVGWSVGIVVSQVAQGRHGRAWGEEWSTSLRSSWCRGSEVLHGVRNSEVECHSMRSHL